VASPSSTERNSPKPQLSRRNRFIWSWTILSSSEKSKFKGHLLT